MYYDFRKPEPMAGTLVVQPDERSSPSRTQTDWNISRFKNDWGSYRYLYFINGVPVSGLQVVAVMARLRSSPTSTRSHRTAAKASRLNF